MKPHVNVKRLLRAVEYRCLQGAVMGFTLGMRLAARGRNIHLNAAYPFYCQMFFSQKQCGLPLSSVLLKRLEPFPPKEDLCIIFNFWLPISSTKGYLSGKPERITKDCSYY